MVKHARAETVLILLEARPAKLMLTITDDGIGFDRVELDRQPGWGMTIMRERALSEDGELRIESNPGKGTIVKVEVQSHDNSRVAGG